jgi:hypothetical protein
MTASDEFHLSSDLFASIIVMGSLCNGYVFLIPENALFLQILTRLPQKAKRE